jgi:hypothetical protein
MNPRLDRIATWVAALLCIAVAAVEVVDHSGLLRRLVEDRLGRQAAEAGGRLRVGSASWRWWRPGLELGEVRLSDADGRQVGYADRIGVYLDARVGRPWLAGVSIDQSKLVLSQGLYDLLETTRTRAGEPEVDALVSWPERLASAPPILARQLEIESLGPNAAVPLPLGTADLWLAPPKNLAGQPTLGGLMRPVAGTGRTPQALQLSGALDSGAAGSADDAIRLTLAGTELPLDDLSRLLPGLRALGLEGTGRLSGELSLPLGPAGQPAGQLEWSCGSFRTRPVFGGLALREASIGARLEFAPRAGDGLYAHDAWSLRIESAGRLGATPVEVEVFAGRWAGQGRSVDLRARLSTLDFGAPLPLPERTTEASPVDVPDWLAALRASLPPEALRPTDDALVALGLGGPMQLDLGLHVRRKGPEIALDGPAEFAAFLRPSPGSSLTYSGWQEDSGRRFGYPITARLEGGTAAFGLPFAAPSTWQLHLADLHGTRANAGAPANGERPAAARLDFEGRVGGPREPRRDGRTLVDLDLDLELAGVRLDRETIGALEELHLGIDLEEAFAPRDGIADCRVRLERRSPRPGLQPWVDVAWRGGRGTESLSGLGFIDSEGWLSVRWSAPRWHDEDWPMPDPEPTLAPGDFGVELAASGGLGALSDARWTLALTNRTELDAEMPEPEGERPRIEDLRLSLRELPLESEELYDAVERLTPGEGERLRELGLSGSAAVTVQRTLARADRDPVQTLGSSMSDLALRQVDEGPLAAAPPVSGLRGWTLLNQGAADRKLHLSLVGELGAIADAVSAGDAPSSSSAGGGGQVLLHAAGTLERDLRLDVRVSGIDPRSTDFGAASRPEALEWLEGKFDARLSVDLTRPESSFNTSVRLRDNRLRGLGDLSMTAGRGAPGVRDRNGPEIAGLDGLLHLEGERLTSERLLLELGTTPVRLEDFEAGLDGERVAARVWIEDLPLNASELLEFAPEGQWREVLEYGRWRGRLDVQGALLELRDGDEFLVRGPVVPKDVYLEVGLPLQVSRARIEVDRLRVRDGRVALDGRATDVYGSLGGRRLAEGRFELGYSDGELRLREIHGRLAGGDLGASADGQASQLSLDLVEPYRFDLRLFGREFEVDQVVADLFGSVLESRGELDLEVSLFGRLEDPFSWWGRGSLALRRARLWSLPVVRELFGALGYEATANFDWMRTRFDLEDGQVLLSDAEAHSPLVRLVGGGRMGLDGTLEQDYDLRYSFVDRFGLLSKILYWAQARLLAVAVRGDMGRPRVSVRNSILSVFTGDPEPRPSLPLPPASPLPERF